MMEFWNMLTVYLSSCFVFSHAWMAISEYLKALYLFSHVMGLVLYAKFYIFLSSQPFIKGDVQDWESKDLEGLKKIGGIEKSTPKAHIWFYIFTFCCIFIFLWA